MIAASFVGILCGSGLGLRFRVLTIVPAVVVATVLALCFILLGRVSASIAGTDLLAWSLGLEVGYGVAATALGMLSPASR